ncbi:hypothetical protein A9Q99_16400 [Gammaproteobacteria bacterium 45_16_T64]|nr:hypothetical protein A9Q99_16400 [Gammaproteobacteria bacterium 45_16_T64]
MLKVFYLKLTSKVILISGILALLSCEDISHGPVKVGTILWPGYEPLHLAREYGLYEGHNIDLVELASASDVIRAMANGSLHMATLTLDETIGLLASGLDLSVIGILDVSKGADMVISHQPMTSLENIEGKKIGVETGGVGGIMLAGFLEHAGVALEDVHIVPLNIQMHRDAFKLQAVDIVVTHEPTAGALLREGGHRIFDSSNIPDRIMDVLVVRTDWAVGHREQIQKIISGYFSARKSMHNNKLDAYRKMAQRSGIKYEDLVLGFEGLHLPNLGENRIWLTQCEKYLGQRIILLSALMMKQGLIDSLPAKNLVCDASWLEGVQG